MITVGILTVLAKLAVAGKEITLAGYFGPGRTVDAYLIAILVPTFASSVIAGSIGSAVIPTYIKIRDRQGAVPANEVVRTVITICVVALALLTAVIALAAGGVLHIVGPGLDQPTRSLAKELIVILAPSLFFAGIATTFAALLNANAKYAIPALVPALTPVVPTAVLLILNTDIEIVALATTAGYAAEALILGLALTRAQIPVRPGWFPSPHISSVARQYGSTVAGASLVSSSFVIDQVMSTGLGPGSVSVLSYGSKVTAFVVQVGAAALSAVVFPQFSQMVAQENWRGIRRTLRTWTAAVTVASAAIACVLVAFSHPIVTALYVRGEFSAQDADAVSAVQKLFLLQVPFYLWAILVVRLLSALQRNIYLVYGAIFSATLNIALNIALSAWLGVKGIALSTSIVYAFTCLLLWSFLRQALGRRESGAVLRV